MRNQIPVTRYQKINKILFVWFLVTGFWYLATINAHADQTVGQAITEVVDTIKDATAQIQETAKPIFDPEMVDAQQKLIPKDEFLIKLRKKRSEFEAKQLEKKRKFFEEMRSKEFGPEEAQKKITAFRKEERKDQESFFKKQKEQLEKYRKEQEKEKSKKSGGETVSARLVRERGEFLTGQEERKRDFLKGMTQDRLENKASAEEVQERVRKFSEDQSKRREKFNEEQRELIAKNSSTG